MMNKSQPVWCKQRRVSWHCRRHHLARQSIRLPFNDELQRHRYRIDSSKKPHIHIEAIRQSHRSAIIFSNQLQWKDPGPEINRTQAFSASENASLNINGYLRSLNNTCTVLLQFSVPSSTVNSWERKAGRYLSLTLITKKNWHLNNREINQSCKIFANNKIKPITIDKTAGKIKIGFE